MLIINDQRLGNWISEATVLAANSGDSMVMDGVFVPYGVVAPTGHELVDQVGQTKCPPEKVGTCIKYFPYQELFAKYL